MRPASVTGSSRHVHKHVVRLAARLARHVLPFGMRFLPLTACALLFALPAKADKFWLSDPAAQKGAPATSSPDLIHGVLLGEDADGYHIRIVGGEVVLPKKLVFKVEKDDLTLDAITKSEKDAAEALAAADKERALQQQVARKERQLKAAEAAAKRSETKPAEAAAPKAVAVDAFDPALGVAVLGRGDLMREAQLAYEATGDRSYLKALRQLRRQR